MKKGIPNEVLNLYWKKLKDTSNEFPMQDSQKKRLEQILTQEMKKLGGLTTQYIESDTSVRQMERGYLSTVISLCLSLLKFVISVKLGQCSELYPLDKDGKRMRCKGSRPRKYLSLFGELEFSRPSYYSSTKKMVYPLDESLNFPPDLWSYNIQELVGGNASETNYRESVRLLNDLLDLNLSGSGSERGIARLGAEVENYYATKTVSRPAGLVHFSASFDGKGVPKRQPKKKDDLSKFARLGKGEKRGVKQMATVGGMCGTVPTQF